MTHISSLKPDSFGDYLKEIGRHPLLTRAQEIEYSRVIARRNDLEAMKSNLEASLDRGITKQEWAEAAGIEVADIQKIVLAAQRAKDKMIRHNLRLVVAVAKKYQGCGLGLQDLVQEGAIGLNRAAEKYNAEKGWKFSTYAFWWIRQSVIRAIPTKGRIVRLPIHVVEALNKIKKACKALAIEKGRKPTIEELATKSGLPPEKVKSLLIANQSPLSTDKILGNNIDGDATLLSYISSEEDPVEFVRQDQMSEFVKKMLEGLTEKECFVIEQTILEGRSLDGVGAEMGCSKETARQIKLKALRKLKAMARSRGVNCPMDLGYGSE
jgi:RNA polymerase sigma factor (sigma-70 family)